MSQTEARTLINQEGHTHVLLAYFRKADGTTRRMLFVYEGATSRKPQHMVVHDIEKGQDRTINLETLQSLRVLKSRVKRQDRPPVKRSYADVKAELDELFY